MRKIFVLDTSVLVYDPNSYKSFSGNDVVIPITVLDELDKIKKFANESGKNARVSIRSLDAISNEGEIHNGISIEEDILLKIDTSTYGAVGPDPTYGDSKILACASKIKEENPEVKVILVSKDINLRTRAKAFGLVAQDYEKDRIQSNDLYQGFRTIACEDGAFALLAAGMILVQDYPELQGLFPHECVLLTDESGKGIAPGRFVKDRIQLIKDKNPWGLELRNKEQLFATDLILDPSIPLITLMGKSGSGKTLVALACGLELTLEKRLSSKMIIYRPIQPVGNDVGYLPGPQPLDAKVLTPSGWTTMGELKVGDLVIAGDGKPSKVLNIFPKGIKPVYKITTTDGRSTEACEDHLWLTKTSDSMEEKGSIKSTKEMMINFPKKNKLDYYIPYNNSGELTETDLLRYQKVNSITFSEEKEVQCILIDHPDHLYITDDFIVTHNTIEEKLEPWMSAINDGFEFLLEGSSRNKEGWKHRLHQYIDDGRIQMEAITYIRGRSIPAAYMLIDECQNLSKEEVKTILTRAGNGTKIILTGDIEQIDNSYLDATNNGLSYVIEKFKESDLAGHITFTKGERSPLATKASEIL